MKKAIIVFFIIMLTLPVGTIAAYDGIWGLNLNVLSFTLPSIQGGTLVLNQTNKANFWYRGRWNNTAQIEIDGGVAFGMDWYFGESDSSQLEYYNMQYSLYPILSKLNFHGNSGSFGYKVGRYMLRDPAGLILNVPLDGMEFEIDLDAHIFEIGAGYTGLQFNQSTTFSMTNSDTVRSSETTVLATPRFIEYASWSMPSVTSWLNPVVYFLAVQDVTSDSDLTTYDTQRFQTMYLELRNRGFLGKSFIYDMSLAGQWGSYGDSNVLAGIGHLALSWLPTTQMQFGVEGTASTGDSWERPAYQLTGPTGSTGTSGTQFNQYLPISSVSSHGYVINFDLGNMISLAAFFKHSVSRGFSWEFKTTSFIRPVDGPVSSGFVDTTSQGNFIGQEALIVLNGHPSPNFNWNIKIGALIPSDDMIVLNQFVEPYLPVIPRIGCNFIFKF